MAPPIVKRLLLIIILPLWGCADRGGACTTVAECCAQFHSCGSDGGGSPFDLGTTAGAPAAICARYVSCATAAAPAEAAATLMAYGPSGTCWQSTPEVAADCAVACQRGIEGLHGSDGADCPLCQSNADCGGATPACDSTKGECVACTTNAECAGDTPICKSDQCVGGCLDDSQCNSSSPVCDPSSNQCYQCLSDGDCAASPNGKGCDVLSHSCGCGLLFGGGGVGGCDPGMICESDNLCCAPECGGAECGAPLVNGCGSDQMNYCGTCDKGGSCWMGLCQKAGQACTPGNGDCYSTEACAFDRTGKSYQCAKDVSGTSCSDSSDCSFIAGDTGGDWYECQAGECRLWCQTTADCPGDAACNPFGGLPISTTWPGVCSG